MTNGTQYENHRDNSHTNHAPQHGTWHESATGSLPTTLAPVESHGVLWQANESEFILHLPGQARFWVKQPQPIQVERAATTSDIALRLFSQGLPLAAHFVQRQYFTLHAAALATPHGAIVLVGHSATGKSTLAAALARRGYALLADEVTPLTITPSGTLQVEPAVIDLFLWRTAIEKLAFPLASCIQARPGLERYLLPQQPVATTAQPLAAIYILGQSNLPEVQFEAITGQQRFLSLQNHAYNRYLPAAPALRQRQFLQLTMSLAKTHIHRLQRPRGDWSIPEIVDAIEHNLQRLFTANNLVVSRASMQTPSIRGQESAQ